MNDEIVVIEATTSEEDIVAVEKEEVPTVVVEAIEIPTVVLVGNALNINVSNEITTTTTTDLTGILKGNGSTITTATAGTDYVTPNAAITGATKTKITYDAKGLVTNGADATTADIADSTDKRYCTDAQKIVIGNTSGTNTGDQTNISGNAATATTLATARAINGVDFNGSAAITVPVNNANDVSTDADVYLLWTATQGGNYAAKTSVGLKYHPSTGLLTAAGFSGPLTGNVTGTASGNLVSGGALGTPSSGTLTNCTFPTLNQNTTGSAASLSISGQTGLLTFTGLTSTSRVKTVRDAADTILELGGSYTPTGTWSWTSATVTWPTFNQNTSGTAAGLSATLAVGSGGTGSTTGSITGSGALTFTAGGTNQYINLKPSGSGGISIINSDDTEGLTIYPGGSGLSNIKIGYGSLTSTTTGSKNVAVGRQCLASNTTHSNNVALGYQALYANDGDSNMAIGYQCLYTATTAHDNTAVGVQALYGLTDGYYNVAIGEGSLYGLSSSCYQNVGIGHNAGVFQTSGSILSTLTNSIMIGYDSRSSGNNEDNEIVIGASSRGNGSNTVTIGNSSITNTYLQGTVHTNAITGSGALTFASGGTNQNINLNPSGTGRISMFNGYGSIYVTTDANFAFGSSGTLANITGNGVGNVGVGSGAFQNLTGNFNVAIGVTAAVAATNAYNSIYIGYSTVASGYGVDNEIVIGTAVTGNGSNTVTIGNTSITDNYFTGVIHAATLTSSTALTLNAGGSNQNITLTPSGSGYVRTNGFLGINTIPSYPLDLLNAFYATQARIGQSLPLYFMQSYPAIGFNVYYAAGNKYGTGSSSNYAQKIWGDSTEGKLYFSTSAAAGNADAAATVSDRMVIDKDGNVGIGITSPTVKLEVNGSTKTSALLANSDDSGALGASGTAFSDLFLASGGVINWNAGNATITHSTGLLTSNVTLSAPRHIGTVSALTTGATVALNAALGDYFTLTPDQSLQINASNALAGQTIKLKILTSGTTSYTVTFGTNFKSTGTLATGTSSAKIFNLVFACYDGTNFEEISRTTAY